MESKDGWSRAKVDEEVEQREKKEMTEVGKLQRSNGDRKH